MSTKPMTRIEKPRSAAASAPEKPSRAKLLLPLVLAVASLLMTACGWQGAGTVAGKELHEGYWYSSSYCAAYDGKGNCTMTMYQNNYVADSYSVNIKDEAGEVHSVSVNKDYYDAVNEGDAFDNRDKK